MTVASSHKVSGSRAATKADLQSSGQSIMFTNVDLHSPGVPRQSV